MKRPDRRNCDGPSFAYRVSAVCQAVPWRLRHSPCKEERAFVENKDQRSKTETMSGGGNPQSKPRRVAMRASRTKRRGWEARKQDRD